MSDCTVVFGDLAKSSKPGSLSRAAQVLEIIDAIPESARFKNTWGDAFVAVFDSAGDALEYALRVRDKSRLYDWRALDIAQPPLFRISLAAGAVNWQPDSLRDCEAPEGGALVIGARVEPITRPGQVNVTQTVHDLAGETNFFYEDLGSCDLPKNSKQVHLYRAFWQQEATAIRAARYGPLFDKQYYRRADALRRFALLWLLLDQLPRGSWGRSIPSWMNEVWRDIPSLTPNPLMEDEGGFETTVLNLECLASILGPDRLLQSIGYRAIQYLEERHGPHGFGSLSLSRQGYSIASHPRHTALAGWFFGKVLKSKTLEIPELCRLFYTSALALFGGDVNAIHREFQEDRNPLLLYLAAWHVAYEMQSPEWSKFFDSQELQRLLQCWTRASASLLDNALAIRYSSGKPEHLGKERGAIFPLTVPYGGFVRMEAYSVLSAAMLVEIHMPKAVLHRIREGIEFMVDGYLAKWPWEKRYKRDRLQPVHCGPLPYYASDPKASPDLGTAAMLLRVCRSERVKDALWGGHVDEKIERIRYFLEEDLVQLFDRYLCDPKLYSLTHAGMLAGVLVGDGRSLTEGVLKSCPQLAALPALELTEATVDDILSERKIEELIQTIVVDDGITPKMQIAGHSLSRLLLDKLRPGRYIKENLDAEGIREIAAGTLAVYKKHTFVQKFAEIWADNLDTVVLAPFLNLLPERSRIADIGCGPGQYALELMMAGHEVVLIDGSPHFLAHARDRIKKVRGEAPESVACDILDEFPSSALPESSFDAIWCCGTFVHIPIQKQVPILKWFSRLLRPDGYLFVNIALENPRMIAKDGRYFSYVSDAQKFGRMLEECGYRTEYVLQRSVRNNTYHEPFFEAAWANYYAQKISEDEGSMLATGDLAVSLTSLAYTSSVEDFIAAHLKALRDTRRKRYIDLYINKMEKYIGDLDSSRDAPHVLDAGCGPGDYVIEMARRGWEAVGVDISDKMLAYAMSNCPAELRHKVMFVSGDFRSLPEEWESQFDGILCVTALQHIPVEHGNMRHVLLKFLRTLRRGGVLRIDIQLNRESGFDPDLRFIQGIDSPEIVEELLKDVGFTTLESSEWELPEGQNSYQRPIVLKFAEFWARKKTSS